MAVRNNVGKIGAALEAGRSAANNIDYGPIRTMDVVGSDQGRFIADWHEVPTQNNIFIHGVHNWASTTLKVAK